MQLGLCIAAVATLLLLPYVSSNKPHPSRALLQSTNCSPSQWIPRCQVCRITKLISSGMQPVPVCWRCQPSYQRINKGRACVCEPGKYDDGTQCVNCGLGSYCPGVPGNYIAQPGDRNELRGRRLPCDKAFLAGQHVTLGGLTTLKQRATEWKDCVPKPGYYLTSLYTFSRLAEPTQTAAVCDADKYSPGYKRLTSCIPCPKGLVTLGKTPADHDALNDCIIPPGTYYVKGLGYPCPVGMYREEYVPFLVPNSVPPECKPCGFDRFNCVEQR